jgi:hypothetical protein
LAQKCREEKRGEGHSVKCRDIHGGKKKPEIMQISYELETKHESDSPSSTRQATNDETE